MKAEEMKKSTRFLPGEVFLDLVPTPEDQLIVVYRVQDVNLDIDAISVDKEKVKEDDDIREILEGLDVDFLDGEFDDIRMEVYARVPLVSTAAEALDILLATLDGITEETGIDIRSIRSVTS